MVPTGFAIALKILRATRATGDGIKQPPRASGAALGVTPPKLANDRATRAKTQL